MYGLALLSWLRRIWLEWHLLRKFFNWLEKTGWVSISVIGKPFNFFVKFFLSFNWNFVYPDPHFLCAWVNQFMTHIFSQSIHVYCVHKCTFLNDTSLPINTFNKTFLNLPSFAILSLHKPHSSLRSSHPETQLYSLSSTFLTPLH